MKLQVFILLLTLCTFYTSYGQNVPVKSFDIKDGLSNNSVNSIYQDSRGFMWFGSHDGLNRYDGYEFVTYRNIIDDSLSLKSNYVYCITGDNQNNLWIGGPTGLCMRENGSGQFHRLHYKKAPNQKKQLLEDVVSEIVHIPSGYVLAGTQTHGLICYKNKNNCGIKVPFSVKNIKHPNYEVGAIEPYPGEDKCLVFVNDIGLCTYSIDTNVLRLLYPAALQVNCLLRQGREIWIGSDDGLYIYNEREMSLSDNLMPDKVIVTRIIRDKDNRLLIGTDGSGLYQFDLKTKKITRYDYAATTFLKSPAVMDIFKDADGNRWVGTLRGGIIMQPNTSPNFNHVIYENSNAHEPTQNYILSFCEDDKHNIWIGTDGGGMRYWNRKNNTSTCYSQFLSYPHTITANYVTSIVQDDSKAIWAGTWGGGVNKMDIKKNIFKPYRCYNPDTGNFENHVWLIFKDSKQRLWASTIRNGHLYKYNEKENTFELFFKNNLDLLCITEDRDGTFWAGNFSSIVHIDPETKKITQTKIGYPVRSILTAGNGTLWIGTAEGGLLLYDIKTEKFIRYTTQDGLPGNTILQILPDKLGHLWISTYNGLSRYSPKQKIFRNYTVTDGLQSNQFNYNAGLALASGELLFGGINGFNIFYPDKIKDAPNKPKLLLSDVIVNNIPIAQKQSLIRKTDGQNIKSIQLPYDQTNLKIDFVSLDFLNADKIKYTYVLQGWDQHWNLSGKGRDANYTRLQEGTYYFKVKTTNIHGKWSQPVTLLTITVSPPWYRTWWAYTLYIFLMAAALYSYLRYNRHKERMRYELKLANLENKREKELSEKQISMFTYISHEFRTPLSLIINPIKSALKKEQSQLPLKSDLKTAHRNARRLLSLVDQLLVFRKAENNADELKVSKINIDDICEEVYKCFRHQAAERNILFTMLPTSGNNLVYADYEKLEIILFNLLSNAFKYTPDNGSISIEIIEDDANFRIIVSDSGCGIDGDKLDHIFDKFYRVNSGRTSANGFGIGLFIVKYYTELHRGTINCYSKTGQGTTFALSIPGGNAHIIDIPIHDHSDKTFTLLEELVDEDSATAPDETEKIDREHLTDRNTILIVDDNKEMRSYLTQLFSEKYYVYTAADGNSGISMVSQRKPDIIVSDIAMDGMDGLDLCRLIKTNDEYSYIPIILLTATTSNEIQLKGINYGADDYITKPFNDDILLARVETLLKSRSQLKRYFLDSITLKEHNHKVPLEYRNFLNRCIEIIEANLENEDFTIKDFSKAMAMSHSSLYKKIKTISGQTVTGFIRSVRLRRAAVIMLTESITIAEAGSKVGIDDQRYFRRKFIELFGMTPSDYIKKYRHTFNRELNIIQK